MVKAPYPWSPRAKTGLRQAATVKNQISSQQGGTADAHVASNTFHHPAEAAPLIHKLCLSLLQQTFFWSILRALTTLTAMALQMTPNLWHLFLR